MAVTLPTCECVEGLPLGEQLAEIYCAVWAWTEDASLPSCLCVRGLPLGEQLTSIYEAITAATDAVLPDLLCVRGYPLGEQLTAIYEAILSLTGDADLPSVLCIRGLPLFQQVDAIFCAALLVTISSGFDPDAEAFFVRAGITDTTQKDAVDALVRGLKLQGIWTGMVALYPFVGGNASAHSKNLKADQYNITWNGTVIHNANGVASNGTTGYGDTGMARNVLPLVGLHLSGYLQTVAAEFDGTIGIDDAGAGHFTELYHTAGASTEFGNNTTSTGAGAASDIGMWVGSRSATDDQILAPSQNVFGTNTSPALADHLAGNFFVLAVNRSGAAALFCADVHSFISAGTELTLAESLALRTLVNSYQTALGRNV